MRLALDPRARRLLRRLPRNTVYSALELVLLSLLAVQCARLLWTLVTPMGPVGEWKAGTALRPVTPAASAVLGTFDPFFRLSAERAGPVMVTSLNLKLFGVREDRASGRGSAIIGTPDGQQRSFAVGDEIVPGVTLAEVGYDSVTVSRGGTREQLFLDQSTPANVVGPSGAAPSVVPPVQPQVPVVSVTPMTTETIPANPMSEIQFQPRTNGGEVTGVAVQPQGSGNAFRAAGLQPGDVVTSVNGQRITSADQARAIAGQLRGGEANVQVERGGRTVSLRVRAGQ
ncbi:MAG TPA: type II secretion system protein N [Sphingomicrobium sp.]|nr:type II secretion system protein N [Sphingomicrobium sp.]